MANLDDIIGAIEAVDERIEELWDRVLDHSDTPLADGTWRVRDALSHLAARANGVERVLVRARAAADPSAPQPPAPRSVDEINASQVEERKDKSVRELLDEIVAGHRDAIVAARQIDRATLQQMIPIGFQPGERSVADTIIRGGPGHDHGHLDQIEAVLPPE